MKCTECGKDFITESTTRLYCDARCQRNAQNKRAYRRRGLGKGVCTSCHQGFVKRINRKQKICSDCFQKKVCINCGKEFKTRSRKQTYCSVCYYELIKKPRANEHVREYKFGPTTCSGCGKTFIRTSNKKQCICLECRKLYKRPKKVLSIPERLANGNRKLDHRSGYVYIYAPEHLEANTRGYVYEHRVIAEQKIGRRLFENEIVHHKDENRWNNSPDNLEVMDRAEHARLHNLGKKRYIFAPIA